MGTAIEYGLIAVATAALLQLALQDGGFMGNLKDAFKEVASELQGARGTAGEETLANLDRYDALVRANTANAVQDRVTANEHTHMSSSMLGLLVLEELAEIASELKAARGTAGDEALAALDRINADIADMVVVATNEKAA